MTGNLIVVSGQNICFSNHLFKPNGILTQLHLASFLDYDNNRFVIPLKEQSHYECSSELKIDPVFKDKELEEGPLNIVIHNHSSLSETRVVENRKYSVPIYINNKNIYVRSNVHSIESAATAASYLYKDPVEIYLAAFKACGINKPPLFYGNLGDLVEQLKVMYELDSKLVELHTQGVDKNNSDYKFCLKRFRSINEELDVFLKLKRA